MYRAISYPYLTGSAHLICAPLINPLPDPLRCWKFYSIFTEVFPLSKKHIHSFNPKSNFLETALNQTGEKKKNKKRNGGSRKEISKQEDLLTKGCKRSLSSLFSFVFVFSDCSSTENVPKTIYAAKIVGYRWFTYRGIFRFDAVGLTLTQI